ncbi:hypothetical protein GOP47_0020127 [Adiantum capillus-veneris]|uniref:Dienelactone hydrolase domain-containing protein n=1 Tax=Adiantum capillus-veneris TaxID=13818 RepID=A0A9D4UCV8_ADICA|nr:hypothetical protein GOP47_0020127 [Adiantum capillus-veneris]
MPTTGPHAGKCCVAPPADEYASVGREVADIGGLPAYLTGSPSAASALLFISDIYGWKVPQTRRLADKVALEGGFLVVLPDFMEDDFFASSNPDNPYEGLDVYLAKHSQAKAIVEASKIIEELNRQGFKRVGVVGFCWGGKITVSLINGSTKVDASVMLHPSFLLEEEIQAVKVPLAILGAEIDEITPPQMANEFGAILAKIPEVQGKTMVKIFEGGDHGFSTRYDPQDAEAVARATEACNDMINWFQKYCL